MPLYRLLDATTDPAWISWPEMIAAHGLAKNDAGPTEQLTGTGTAIRGSGLMLMGLTESYEALVHGRLVAPLGPEFVHSLSYSYRLVWPAGRTLTRPMRLFRDWIVDERDTYLESASRVLGVALS